MKKYGWKFIVLIFLIALVALLFFWFIKAEVMSFYLSDKMRVPVSVRTISIWPRTTIIHGFKIMNPRGFTSEAALSAEKTTIDYTWKHLRKTPSEIDQIVADKVLLTVDLSNRLGKENNWKVIGAHMPKKANRKRVIVHKLILTNMTVQFNGMDLGTRYFDRMEFDEIDSDEGFPTKELVNKIFKNAGIEQFIEDVFDPFKLIEGVNPLRIF